MATEVARKGLNPEAPEFFPKDIKLTLDSVDPNLYLPSFSIFSPPNTSFYYPSQSSLLHLPTAFPDPLLSQPFYASQPFLLTPQHDTFFPSPTQLPAPQPSPVIETPPCLAMGEQNEVVAEKVNLRGIRRGGRNRGFERRDDGYEKRSTQEWRRVKVYDAENQNFRMVRYNPIQKKQHIAEMVPVEKDGNETTVMIRNIPNKYTRQMLLHFLEEHCSKENLKLESENGGEAEEHILSAFDFLYLPMDFKTGLNKSYAFVNFTDPRAVWKFHLATHNQKWELFHSSKIREIAGAKIQGKEALIEHFKPSTFHCDSDDYLPVCFSPPMDGLRELVKQSLVGKRIPMHY